MTTSNEMQSRELSNKKSQCFLYPLALLCLLLLTLIGMFGSVHWILQTLHLVIEPRHARILNGIKINLYDKPIS